MQEIDYQNAWLISNNIIYKNGGVGLEIYETNNVDIINNTTFKNNRNDAVKCGEIVLQSAKNVSVYNNIFYANHLKPEVDWTIRKRAVLKQFVLGFNTLSTGTVDIQVDPLFQRANAFENIMDFSLRPKSPPLMRVSRKLPAYDF
ncbi:MAG: right-handed parallel beta-helix repeat-containing protein [Saprospiraceae bacterium]|nr:right-handed parallel beta-helix repeat-containing protein [Saprospiraceae bacterium]